MEKEDEVMTLMNEHNLKELLKVVFSVMTDEQLREVKEKMKEIQEVNSEDLE